MAGEIARVHPSDATTTQNGEGNHWIPQIRAYRMR
jgi:hypothetical protein